MSKFTFFISVVISFAAFAKDRAFVEQLNSKIKHSRYIYCRSSIDCVGSLMCRDRGDGYKVCMGEGYQGDSCRSSIDCVGSLMCHDRGDGYKVCMGEGYQGDSCRSSIDCVGSLMCHDRGDGIKFCW